MEENSKERDRLLTKIDANLDNLIDNVEKHIIADSRSFEEIHKKLDKNDSRIGWLQKIIFMGLGALALMRFFLK